MHLQVAVDDVVFSSLDGSLHIRADQARVVVIQCPVTAFGDTQNAEARAPVVVLVVVKGIVNRDVNALGIEVRTLPGVGRSGLNLHQCPGCLRPLLPAKHQIQCRLLPEYHVSTTVDLTLGQFAALGRSMPRQCCRSCCRKLQSRLPPSHLACSRLKATDQRNVHAAHKADFLAV